mmetsp:Transcript_7871/g.11893  ORF Transcript_7871/g.11893 Transcript_7871/m.11893 type:complete len:210 (+) Transcript_7871:179-808(+)|eukprot:CAMPEP_0171452354 /NCGR_PEP_ID=MMETSP0945-20130129/497_1 /TAXON_ID=109269 /ORGANISM="Vaucheria litorea, Strain CCMP2940" /LENGTH=209 /DNA_ID=CAMNT_0011977007 /DNA_START=151 /DNA_END=780 /DNA_ORIENTATION=+
MPADDAAPEIEERRINPVQAGLCEYEVYVNKQDFTFHAAHFIAYDGFRERIHGHNYNVGVKMKGEVAHDGYVVDFGDLKTVTRRLCAELDEKFLCPQRSNVINSKVKEGQVVMRCQDRSTYSFPEKDCALLPIMHSSNEELAHYLYNRLVHDFTPEFLRLRGIKMLEIVVQDTPGQEATYRQAVPSSLQGLLLESPCSRKAVRLEPTDT